MRPLPTFQRLLEFQESLTQALVALMEEHMVERMMQRTVLLPLMGLATFDCLSGWMIFSQYKSIQ
jgi:hypothetical protein